MKSLFLISILPIAFLCSVAQGQDIKPDISSSLEALFGRLSSSREDADRIRINDSIKSIIESYALSDTIFTHKFSNLKYLGQVGSDNSQLKLLTWNLLLERSDSRYFCYFIHRSGKKNFVNKLEGTYQEKSIRGDTTYSEKDWYGALYYDIKDVKKDKQTYWILLGIDYGNPLITRKVIDILSFTPDGKIILGKKLFVAGNIIKYREVLEYSSEAVISLKFLNDKSIVFDHLVPVSPSLKEKKEYYGPDYSYDAYNLEKGMWRFKANVDIRNKKKK
jgi:hypothetical protein